MPTPEIHRNCGKGLEMYCPLCRSEYRDGFTFCAECHAGLVEELPAEEPPQEDDLVSVFEGDLNSAAVIRTMLKCASIEAWIKNEEEHAIFPNLEPTEVLVARENRKAAMEAIETPQYDAKVASRLGHSSSKTPGIDPSLCKPSSLRDEREHIRDTSRRPDDSSH